MTEISVLIEQCCAGDDSAWSRFTATFHRLIVATVIRHTARADIQSSAEDLVQEVYLRLCRDQFRILRESRSSEPGAVFALVRSVAVSVVYDHYRSMNAGKRGGKDTVISYDALVQDVADHRDGAAQIDERLFLEQISRALTAVTPPPNGERDRAIFWLYYRQGMTARSIAEIPALQLSAKGVESLLFRLLKSVKIALASNSIQRKRIPETDSVQGDERHG